MGKSKERERERSLLGDVVVGGVVTRVTVGCNEKKRSSRISHSLRFLLFNLHPIDVTIHGN